MSIRDLHIRIVQKLADWSNRLLRLSTELDLFLVLSPVAIRILI